MSGDVDPRDFYTQRVPAQWNAVLERQRAEGPAGARLLEEMRAVDATISVRVDGEDGGTFHLNIASGRMHSADVADHDPLLTILHDGASLDALARESGDSILGFLGGLAGLEREITLTRQRVAHLRELEGVLRFELRGPDGFALFTCFGGAPHRAEPDCSIAVDRETFVDLRSGKLEPHDAFLSGRISVEGDMQMAMQLALAALAPD